MRTVHLRRYGTPDDVEIVESPEPIPGDGDVLVKVKAASLNATDIEIIRGDPIIRMANGVRKPRNNQLGCDLSGTVKEVGNLVRDYQVGDEICVDVMYQNPSYGAFSEYIVIPDKRLRRKPSTMSFEEAATIPQAGVLAVQGIIEPDPPKLHSKVLINGAGGGVGSFAIQLAKYYEAEVTAVDHPDKFDFMRSIGADHTISYLDQDFTKLGVKYDIILDVIAKKSIWAYRRALNVGGRYRMVGGTLRRIFGIAFFGMLTSKFSDKDVGLLLGRPNDEKNIKFLAELYKDENIRPQISKVYKLEDIQTAMWELYDGNALGKIVVMMD